jgi:hypothetical protein
VTKYNSIRNNAITGFRCLGRPLLLVHVCSAIHYEIVDANPIPNVAVGGACKEWVRSIPAFIAMERGGWR